MNRDDSLDWSYLTKKYQLDGSITFEITKFESKLVKSLISTDIALNIQRKNIWKLITRYYIFKSIISTLIYTIIDDKAVRIFDFYLLNKSDINKVEKTILGNGMLEIKFIGRSV